MRFATLRTPLVTAALLIFGASTVIAEVEIRAERVHFKPGMSGATVKGKIRGYEAVDYVLEAGKGQQMNVSMATDNLSSYFNILPPGESDAAMFIGSTGGNEFEGTLPKSGDYKIRVSMMRNAARRDQTATYTLNIAILGDASSSAKPPTEDALVEGTKFNATGQIPCAAAHSAPTTACAFGVIRHGGGEATVIVQLPGGGQRYIYFKNGTATSSDQGDKVTTERRDDLNLISIGKKERYEIPDAVVLGG
jgi:hypothetical protein